jgi:hypothetical protein
MAALIRKCKSSLEEGIINLSPLVSHRLRASNEEIKQ